MESCCGNEVVVTWKDDVEDDMAVMWQANVADDMALAHIPHITSFKGQVKRV